MMRNNLFIDGDRDGAYAKSRDSTVIVENNDFSGNRLDTPELEFDNVENHTLDYIPGDPEDEYSYVFAPEDETRRVLDRLGEGQAFGWTLTYAEGYLWRFTAGSVDFLRLDPETGDTVEYRTPDQIMNPRGLTWDGTHFWVNDFSLLKLFKLAVEGREVRVVDSFDIPEKELGGTAGLTNDGEFLYLVSRDGSKLYQLTKQGALVDELELAAPVHHSIVWTGEFFWATGGHHRGISRLTPEGEVVGAIYPPARCTWALAWDGEHLWTVQRTCEMWNDAKVFKLQILDDSF